MRWLKYQSKDVIHHQWEVLLFFMMKKRSGKAVKRPKSTTHITRGQEMDGMSAIHLLLEGS